MCYRYKEVMTKLIFERSYEDVMILSCDNVMITNFVETLAY